MQEEATLTALLTEVKQNQDSSCLELILQKYRPMIITTVKRYHLELHDQDDLLQEASIICYQTACAFDPQNATTTYGSFFKKSLINRYRTLLRKEQALKRRGARAQLSLETFLEENGDMFSDNAKSEGTLIDKLTFINELPLLLSNSEYAVLLAKLECKTVKEIAGKLDLSLSQTYNTLARCREKIGQLAKKLYGI